MSGLSDSEIKMFAEIQTVLDKYQANTREFGLHLVHSHFNVNETEILHETHNKEARTLSVKPILLDNLPVSSKATMWCFDKSGTIKVMQFCCDE